MLISSLFSVFFATAVAGPVGGIVACTVILILRLAKAETCAALRAWAAAQAEAAKAKAEMAPAAAVIAEAEAVIAAARLRLERDASP